MAACSAYNAVAAVRTRGTRIAVCGQSLLEHDLWAIEWPGRTALRRLLKSADAAFTDFEGTVRGPRAGPPTRVLETLHTPSAASLDLLSSLGLTLFATSNNHAYDLGTGGVLDTIAAMRARRLSFAGTGETLAEASAPVFDRQIALVAAAAGAIRPGGAAQTDRPGVNELRLTEARHPVPDDQARFLAALRQAANGNGPVIAYLHNHDWEPDNADTPDWQRGFARAAIDAGASLFVSHGPPLLHGIEIYRGAPLFHGLGSLFFQTRKDRDAYGPLNWQGAIAMCRFDGARFRDAEIRPWQLASDGVPGAHRAITRGVPRPASRVEAGEILARLAERSARLGFSLDHDGTVARIAA